MLSTLIHNYFQVFVDETNQLIADVMVCATHLKNMLMNCNCSTHIGRSVSAG